MTANDALAGTSGRYETSARQKKGIGLVTKPVSNSDTMPTVTLRYRLPDEQGDYDAARLGRQMCMTLWEIDQGLRSVLKHGEPSEETAKLAEEIRAMIRNGCPDALEL